MPKHLPLPESLSKSAKPANPTKPVPQAQFKPCKEFVSDNPTIRELRCSA